MNIKQDRLKRLRQRAEDALKSMSNSPDLTTDDIDELVHELHVYHAELELQLEDLQQAYWQMETSQQQYARLFNFAPIGYITTDHHGVVVDANLTAVTMLGLENATLKNASFTDMLTSDSQDTYHLHRRTVTRDLHVHSCDVQVQRRDGTIFHAQLSTHRANPDTDMLHTAIIDMSAIKQTQEILKQALKHEQQVNQLRSRVLSVITHEFRTPLASMLSAVELLDRYGERMTEDKKQKRYSTIRNMIWYLTNVVQEIGSVQEFDEGSPRLRTSTFALIPFTNQLIADMVMLNEQQQQQVVLHTNSHDEGETVTWDQNLLRRILMNLIGNALKYSDDDIEFNISINEETVSFKIEDSGTGISEDDQEHIYTAFYRGSNTESIPGTGIGLYVVDQAVAAHGGSINCASVVGKGTTFTITLPRHVDSSALSEA
jgi:PAS domain S-box-containing protein